jgi:SAM-dependent MidA family methyltransferase
MSVIQKIHHIINTKSYIAIDELMDLALNSEDSSYYIAHQPIGETGDFITAPEISQMFGEMIALWCIQSWQKMGQCLVNLVELGPGTGTLMADILRTIQAIAPMFFKSINQIILLEINPVLIKLQQQKLNNFGIDIVHCKNISELPQSTSIIIANEFFDALPVKQYKKTELGWQEVVVKYAQEFYFDTVPNTNKGIFEQHHNATLGAVLEISNKSIEIINILCNLISSNQGSILIIDYGYDIDPNTRSQTQYNSSLQAIKDHKFHPVLENISQADLTCHVDFYKLKELASAKKLSVNGSENQRNFLQKMGISLRLANLIVKNPTLAKPLTNQHDYLINTMGNLFRVLDINNHKF